MYIAFINTVHKGILEMFDISLLKAQNVSLKHVVTMTFLKMNKLYTLAYRIGKMLSLSYPIGFVLS